MSLYILVLYLYIKSIYDKFYITIYQYAAAISKITQPTPLIFETHEVWLTFSRRFRRQAIEEVAKLSMDERFGP